MMINLNEQLVDAISQTVIHSLWQGILIGFILFAVMKRVDSNKAELRYQLSLGALLSVFIAGLYTFLYFIAPNHSEEVVYQGNWIEVVNYLSPLEEGQMNLVGLFSEYNSYISNFWIIGVVFLSVRLLLGLWHIASISQRSTLIVNRQLENLVLKLKSKLGIEKSIHVYESEKTDSPITFGFFKSFILMPVGLVNQLSTEEVELILVHELGHITRNDFLINIFQTIVETLFYYHPVVWWISHRAKVEL